jgi:lysophospholipase L1-like esterase
MNGAIFRPLVIGRLLTADEKVAAKAWVQAAIDGATSYSDTPTAFSESAPIINEGSFYRTSSFARAVYETEATVIGAEIYSGMSAASTPQQQPGEGVLVDGAYSTILPVSTPRASKHRFYLPPGSKTLSFENGYQTDDSLDGVPEGTFIKRVWADRPLTPALPTPVAPILVYGDSVSVGQISSPNAQHAWLLQVRRSISRTIASEGYGGRSLYADAANGTLRAALVAKLASYNPTTIWIAIGANDYILNLWSAAAFEAAYAATLDDLHAALPSTAIYCQTPIVKTSEVANGLGVTLPNIRTAIGNAVSPRTGYATLVDGTTIVTTADLPDGLHPSTAAQATYAAFFKSTLGL